MSFERADVPVAFVVRPDFHVSAYTRDTVDQVDPALLETATGLATAIVVTVAAAGQ